MPAAAIRAAFGQVITGWPARIAGLQNNVWIDFFSRGDGGKIPDPSQVAQTPVPPQAGQTNSSEARSTASPEPLHLEQRPFRTGPPSSQSGQRAVPSINVSQPSIADVWGVCARLASTAKSRASPSTQAQWPVGPIARDGSPWRPPAEHAVIPRHAGFTRMWICFQGGTIGSIWLRSCTQAHEGTRYYGPTTITRFCSFLTPSTVSSMV